MGDMFLYTRVEQKGDMFYKQEQNRIEDMFMQNKIEMCFHKP